MKRTLVAAVLGLVTATTVFGQGSILFNNYVTGTYNQVYWNPGQGPRGNLAVLAGEGVVLQLYFGEGILNDYAQLTAGVTSGIALANYDPGAGHGGGGYYTGPTQLLPTWSPGDTFTFGIRAIGPAGVSGETVLWQEQANLRSTSVAQTGFLLAPGLGLNIPEPTTFALVGLGSAAMLIFRRRRA